MPASRVRAIISCASFSSTFATLAKMPVLEPNVIAPNERRETTSPVSPNRAYCITPIVTLGLWMLMHARQREPFDGIAFEIKFDEHGRLVTHNPSGMPG